MRLIFRKRNKSSKLRYGAATNPGDFPQKLYAVKLVVDGNGLLCCCCFVFVVVYCSMQQQLVCDVPVAAPLLMLLCAVCVPCQIFVKSIPTIYNYLPPPPLTNIKKTENNGISLPAGVCTADQFVGISTGSTTLNSFIHFRHSHFHNLWVVPAMSFLLLLYLSFKPKQQRVPCTVCTLAVYLRSGPLCEIRTNKQSIYSTRI